MINKYFLTALNFINKIVHRTKKYLDRAVAKYYIAPANKVKACPNNMI